MAEVNGIRYPRSSFWIDGGEVARGVLDDLLQRGYSLFNYRPGYLCVFGPPPYGGGVGCVIGPVADDLGAIHDAWNFRVWTGRVRGEIPLPCDPEPRTPEERARVASYWRPQAQRHLEQICSELHGDPLSEPLLEAAHG